MFVQSYSLNDDSQIAYDVETALDQDEVERWKPLIHKKRPKDSLRRTLIAKPGKTPPLYGYGFPYAQQYALDSARRHYIKLKLVGEDIEAFGGRKELDFADGVDDS